MTANNVAKKFIRMNEGRGRLLLLTVILIAAVLGAWWIVGQTDLRMRAELLQKTRLVAGAVNLERVRALTGTDADLGKPDYLRLKEQFAEIRAAEPNYRFVYLMGVRPDGKVFFFVDDRPVGDAEESPAGMIYDDVPEGFRRVLATGIALVEGPFTDKWGSFVSGCVPLADPKSGKILAILAVDFDAKSWKWDLAGRAALPVGLLLLTMIGFLTALTASGHGESSAKPALRRLMPVLTVILTLLAVLAWALLWHQHQERINGRTALVAVQIKNELGQLLDMQAQGLVTALQAITMDDRARQGLKSGDRERLLADWKPLYETLHKEQGLTHFYFSDAKRVCLMRLHKPEKFGDRFDRFTILEAERTGKTASGIELGPLGTFTLRVVQPVFDGPTIVGYVELGKEIEDVLEGIKANHPGVDVAVTINKDMLKRELWESGMRLLGREADWERLPNSVIIYASQGRLPDAFAALADDDPAVPHDHGIVEREIFTDNKYWRVTVMPLDDASGKEVGDLLVINDITGLKSAFIRDINLGGAAGLILLAVILAIIFVILRRTDEGIQKQQKSLRESEERQHLLTEHAVSAIAVQEIVLDSAGRPVDYVFLSVNPAFEIHTGLKPAEVIGRRATEVFPGIEKTPFIEIYGKVALFGEPVSFEQYSEPLGRHYAINAYKIEEKRFATIFNDITESKNMEKELKRAHEQYKSMLQNTPSISYRCKHDKDWTMVFISDMAYQMTGYPASDFVGNAVRTFESVIHRDDTSFVAQSVDSAISAKQPWEIEYRIVGKDGNILWVQERGTGIFDDKGDIDCLDGIILNITDRKKVEEELLNSEKRFLDVLYASEDAILLIGDNTFIDCNDATARMLGYPTREEFLQTHPSVLSPPKQPDGRDSFEKAEEMMRLAFVKGFHRFEWMHRRANGEDFPVAVSLTPIISKGRKLLHCVWQDITERKKAEENLAKITEQYMLAVKGSNDGIWDWNIKHNSVFFSERWKEQLGYSDLELENAFVTFENLLHPEDKKSTMEYLDMYLNGRKENYSIEFRMRHKDGSYRWILARGKALRDENGKAIRMAGSHTDITAAKQAEEKIIIAKQEAEKANIAKTQFLSNMSHEIRTPMNAILGYSSLMKQTPLNEKQREFLGMIDSGGSLLLGVINDILDVSKFELGKISLESIDFNLEYICHDVFKLLRPRMVELGLDGSVAIAKEVHLSLNGDPTRLRQVLINLFNNAVKFTKKGSVRLDVSVSKEPVKENGKQMIRFALKDTGIGIPEDKREEIFKAFTQADESTTRKYGGTGLGLTICKAIVETMGGKIWVESKEGAGSEFIFEIPMKVSEASSRKDIQPVAFSALKGRRVVIIDDTTQNRDIFTRYCEEAGMLVSGAFESGKEAYEHLSRVDKGDRPDIVLLDVMMPGSSGHEIAGMIKGDTELAGIKLIAVTSDVGIGTAKAAHGSGFDAYLTKPLIKEDLYRVIATLLGVRSRHEEIITRHMANELACQGMRVLVADDSIPNQMLMEEYLKSLGVSVVIVGNGEEALAELRKGKAFDLCLMDIQMPVMGGLEATQIIRAEISKDFPVLALSAAVMQEDIVSGYAAGVTDYLIKPIDFGKLKEALIRWRK
ncbi:MAG: PAS domain S-box protein [Candidatus Omnitrophica bacterium]|nr:PAS domain S-box protein [Candidatus Omnitrophota bacterium]